VFLAFAGVLDTLLNRSTETIASKVVMLRFNQEEKFGVLTHALILLDPLHVSSRVTLPNNLPWMLSHRAVYTNVDQSWSRI